MTEEDSFGTPSRGASVVDFILSGGSGIEFYNNYCLASSSLCFMAISVVAAIILVSYVTIKLGLSIMVNDCCDS